MANQMLIKDGDKQPKLTIEQSICRYISNPELSDVCFLVGDQQAKVYAHRFFLAVESEVFKSMFYGELKETSYEIKVPDLSPIGFRNMIKYFYTKKVEEIDFSEIYLTFMAANKYLASSLIEDLTDHIIKNHVNVSNLCVIYDQLLKLAIDDSLTRDVKLRIMAGFSKASASDSFEQIGEDALIDILKFKMLNITEFELLKACLAWTDCEVARQRSGADRAYKRAGRRAAFEPIKHLIRFGDISLSELGSISELENYLTVEEIGSIFLHSYHPSKPIQIDYRSPREPFSEARVVCGTKKDIAGRQSNARELKFSISADKGVCITSIRTFAISNCEGLKFSVYKDSKELPLDCKIEPFHLQDCCKSYTINLSHFVVPNSKYELRFSFSIGSYYGNKYNVLGTSGKMTFGKNGVEFQVESGLGHHCIETIDFFGPLE